ncbi:MAG TPA: 3-oxoacyl-[acyl-carrier-protein] synthase III C-terminal domain-containing protein [Trebonia sp.]|jgi:alkylresorcinol/alkylpyrone synthase|nr:3-oxoacyl-[acyl-carrier-protein] synthase III C-terminal domain-containing protein [Trebonia sp.]
MTQILSVRSAFPAHRYPQDVLTRAYADLIGIAPQQARLLARLQGNAGVDTRHTVLPLEEYELLGDAGAVNDRYITEATALAERALGDALAAGGVDPADVDLLMLTSVTGVAVPSLDARLIPRLGLRADVKRLPVFGLGCVAGAAGLARLHDYLRGWPDHVAALVSVELCTLTVPVSGVTTADMVVSGLFGDGAAALVAGGAGSAWAGPAHRGESGGPRLPRVVATRSEVFPDSQDALGWQLGAGGFRIVLTTELAEVVTRRLGGAVTGFLAGHGLTIDDIGTWICHPGGPKVIDATRDALKLPEHAVASSRQSLAAVGNLSSASVLHVLELTAAAGEAAPGSFGLMIGLGPGVSAELVLMQW